MVSDCVLYYIDLIKQVSTCLLYTSFGHVHTRRNNTGKDAPRLSMLLPTQYDVGVDNNDFTPVSFVQVKAIIEKQIEQSKKGEQ